MNFEIFFKYIRKSIIKLVVLMFVFMITLLFWASLYYWEPKICSNQLHSGLLGACLGAIFMALVAFIAYWQLNNISKTAGTDFIHRLKNDFFTESARILMDHIIEKRIKFKEYRVEGPEKKALGAYFEMDDNQLFKRFPEEIKAQLMKKKYYLEAEVDDFVLGPLEDIGLFEVRHLIDSEMAYEEFSYYTIEAFENEEIKKYIGDPDFLEQEFRSSNPELTTESIRTIFEIISRDIPSVGLPKATFDLESLIDFLNTLLKNGSLYKMLKSDRKIEFSNKVKTLAAKQELRKPFTVLDGAEQRSRKAFNRIILEDTYSKHLPKNDYIRSDDFDKTMWSNFTYLYYRFKEMDNNPRVRSAVDL
jgi:hypothetical protein